ncbi:hypothetical protein HYV88_05525 [Candidatus Woesearchaeota archaeon]|nr:hypothetical protein [Candidatus Woesearchaeota archaeon]
MDIKININFRSLGFWKDSPKRAEHIFDRMKLRGIGVEQIKEAIRRGAKTIRKDGSIVTEYRWFKVAYREIKFKEIRKIYPITVMEVLR